MEILVEKKEKTNSILGTCRLVTILLLLGGSGITQQDARQSSDVQQVATKDFGFIGISSQTSLGIEDPITVMPGAETSIITAIINDTNKALLIFIS